MDVDLGDVLLWLLIVFASLAVAALRACSRSRIEHLLSSEKSRKRYERYLDRREDLLEVISGVRTLALVWLTIRLAQHLTHSGRGPLATLAGVCAIIVVGGILPATLVAQRWSNVVTVLLLPPLYTLSWPALPLVARSRKLFGAAEREESDHVIDAAKEEILTAIEDGATEGAIEETEREMIEGILEFRDAAVSEIMTPRVDMECVEADLTVREARPLLEKLPHSRIPIYEENRDRIVGILYLRDLFPWLGRAEFDERRIREISRKAYFVPETKRVRELLGDFQSQRLHIAVVLDEYGGVSGLVTIEDILEVIVGEIRDEYDQGELDNAIVQIGPHSLDVDARVHVSEINELLDTDLPEDDDYDTVGGLLAAHLGRIPAQDETVPYGDRLLFRVTAADERRIIRLHIDLLDESGAQAGPAGSEEQTKNA